MTTIESYDRWEEQQRGLVMRAVRAQRAVNAVAAEYNKPKRKPGRPPKVRPETVPAVGPTDAQELTMLILRLGTDAARELLAGLPERIAAEVL